MSPEGVKVLDLSPFIGALARRRSFILKFTGAATALGLALALLLPSWYRAYSSLLPPTEEEAGFGLSSLLKGIGVPGVKIPSQAQPADVFIAELQSRRLNEEIVNRFDLRKRYHKRLTEDAVKELRRHAGFSVNDAGLITVVVEDRDPRQAAAMTTAFVEALDRFNREARMTKGRRTREFVEQRLAETHRQLAAAEDQLAQYLSKRKSMTLGTDQSAGMDMASHLYAQRASLQVQLGVAQQYSRGGTDEVLQLQQQLSQIDQQLATLPVTGMGSARLLRDVKTFETLSMLLTSQYEQARIDEVRDVATVEVLDPATVPEHRARPVRSVLVAISFCLGLAASTLLALRDVRPGERNAA